MPLYTIEQADGWFTLVREPGDIPVEAENFANRLSATVERMKAAGQLDKSDRLLTIAQRAFVENDIPGAITDLDAFDETPSAAPPSPTEPPPQVPPPPEPPPTEPLPTEPTPLPISAMARISVQMQDANGLDGRTSEEIVLANQQTPEELSLVYSDNPGKEPTEQDKKLLVEFRKMEFTLRGICLPKDKRTILGRFMNRILPAFVPPSGDVFGRLLIRLQRIAIECFSARQEIEAQLSDVLLDGLSQDAWSSLAMARKSELFWRFLYALFIAVVIAVAIRVAYIQLSAFDVLNAAVSSTQQRAARSSFVLVFILGAAVGAWLSYVQRGISDLNTGTRGDLEALKDMLAESIHPAVRAFYVMLFAFIAMMLMHLQIVTVKLGPIFNTDNVLRSFSVALLVGLLLGLSERTLPNVVGQKATELVQRIGSANRQGGGGNNNGKPEP